jgi:hypothetical protein
MCAVARRLGGFVYDALFETTQSERGRSKCLHDFTRKRHSTRERVPEGRGPACRRCARCSKMRTIFEKCASWKTPEISSKMRTLFQDAHEKLRNFERRKKIVPQAVGARAMPSSVPGSPRLASPVLNSPCPPAKDWSFPVLPPLAIVRAQFRGRAVTSSKAGSGSPINSLSSFPHKAGSRSCGTTF